MRLVSLEIGVVLPTSTPDPARPILGDVRASARFAEELELGSVWSTDHLIASAPILDSTVVLSTAAAVTERITVGYAVMLLALRPMAWAAKQISTLQYVSGGRVVLGVGTGNPAHGDIGWRAAGVPFRERGARTDRALEVLSDLVEGRTAQIDDSEMTLAPGAPMPPVIVAGDAAAALRRAAAYGDGWACVGLSPDAVAARLEELAALAADHQRPAPAVTVVAPALSEDLGEAVETLAAYHEAGAERVILAPTEHGWQRDYEHAAALRSAMAGG